MHDSTSNSDNQPLNFDAIPDELKRRPQWICWRYGKPRPNGKPEKPIFTPRGEPAASNTPSTWSHFVSVRAAYERGKCVGIGYVFSADDPYTGIDLDDCRDPATGEIAPEAQAIIDRLASFTEITPSGTGVHIWCLAGLPLKAGGGTGKRDDTRGIEMYDRTQYFTVTGHVLRPELGAITARQDEVTALYTEIFGQVKATKDPLPQGGGPVAVLLDDHRLLDKMFSAGNGADVRRLWDADRLFLLSAYPPKKKTGDPDWSRGDLALCSHLAWWTAGDRGRIDRLFRQSGLMRDKWDHREGYREKTIDRAVARMSSYDPDHYRTPQARRRTPKAAETTAPETQPSVQIGQIPTPASQEPQAKRDAPLPLSDYTNSQALLQKQGENTRYVYAWKHFLVWDGQRWAQDDTGQMMRWAVETVKSMAGRIAQIDDKNVARAWLNHIKTSLATGKLEAMIRQVQPWVANRPEDFDAPLWTLNCFNGTLDLRSGTLRLHRRDDLLTKMIPVAYDPEATCPTWDAFLWRIMGGTVEPDSPDDSAATLEARTLADERARSLIAFLQRAVGYCLTGDVREECLFILYGTGQNGKSKFLGAIHDLLGPYAQATHSKTFMATDRMDGIPNDLARLRGARFVSAVELGKGRRLNEELVKRATGADLITARFLHGEFFDFMPQFKLFLACNHLPNVQSVDKAMWRRLYQIPFTVTISDAEKDDALGTKLRTELPGILRWAVEGCLAWQQNGLGIPEEVRQATDGYRADMDVIGRFIEECCLISPQAQTRASHLYEAYVRWCAATGEHQDTMKSFSMYLEQQGFERRLSNGVWRRGLGLLNADS